MEQKEKVIVICGPTASGKTALSIELAKKINKFAFEYDVQNECFHIENNDTKALSESSHSMKGIGTILPEDLDGF